MEESKTTTHRGGTEQIDGKYAAFLEIKNHESERVNGYWRSKQRFDTENEARDYLGDIISKTGYSLGAGIQIGKLKHLFPVYGFKNFRVLKRNFKKLPIPVEDPKGSLEETLEKSETEIIETVEEPEKAEA